jgi:hypothetical protein
MLVDWGQKDRSLPPSYQSNGRQSLHCVFHIISGVGQMPVVRRQRLLKPHYRLCNLNANLWLIGMFPGHAVTVKWLTFCPFIDIITIISKCVEITRSLCVYLMKLLHSIPWEKTGYSTQCIRTMWKEVIIDSINVPPWTYLKGLRRDDPFNPLMPKDL